MKRILLILIAPLMMVACFPAATFMENTVPTEITAQTEELAGDSHLFKYSTFAEYGMEIEKEPQYEGVAGTEMVITAEKSLDLRVGLSKKGTNEYLDNYLVQVIEEGMKWNISFIFPESGEYECHLFGKPLADAGDEYYGIVQMLFSAEVQEGSATYFLDSDFSSEAQKIVINDIKNVTDGYWETDPGVIQTEYKTGVLGEDYNLSVYGNIIPVRKGTAVKFTDYGLSAYDLAVTLEENLTIPTSFSSITFKGGALFNLGYSLSGPIAEAFDLDLGGTILRCPERTIIGLLEGQELEYVAVNGPTKFIIAGKTYECLSVMVYDAGSGFSIETAKDMRINQGNTNFVLPAESYIDFFDNKISAVTVFEPTEVTFDGKKQTFEYEILFFEEDGNFKGDSACY